MSHHTARSHASMTIPAFRKKAAEGRKLVVTTAYDAVTARIADDAGVDAILVGDSVGNVCLGFENTLPVTLSMMYHHLEAVARIRPKALLLCDMPYLTYHLGLEETVRNAGGFMQRGAQAVKLEGGRKRVPVVKALLEAEIPVMGHLGLTPQSIHAMGGYRVQGRAGGDAIQLLDDALRLEEAGCFALTLEGIPFELAARMTEELTIPTIGIGAGPHCDGQVLVFHDILGLVPGESPKFVRKYLEGFEVLSEALQRWSRDVQDGTFPAGQESYTLPEAARRQLNEWHPGPPAGEPTEP